MSKGVLLWVLLLTLSGCTQNRYQFGESPVAASLREGDSLSTILSVLGPPIQLASLDTGMVLSYEYWRVSEDQIGLSLRALGLDFLSVDWGDATIEGEYLLVFLDIHNTLTHTERHDMVMNAGGGRGIQALVSVVDVADTDDFTDPSMPQHRWGAFALDELPVTLNRRSSMLTGQAGIERRGTPQDVGQHALEIP